ncbi:putative RNA recognition motif domain, nucleotide-binding alpha-beta plait domain superfamily [Helianthus anomalus]
MVHLVKLFQFPSMATYYHCLTSISLQHSSSSLPVSKSKSNPTYPLIYRTKLSSLSSSSSSFIQCPQNPATKTQIFTVSALVEGEQQQYYSSGNGYSLQEDSDFRNSFKPYELYVCNLPRSCDIPELLNKFKTYGTVQSVEDDVAAIKTQMIKDGSYCEDIKNQIIMHTSFNPDDLDPEVIKDHQKFERVDYQSQSPKDQEIEGDEDDDDDFIPNVNSPKDNGPIQITLHHSTKGAEVLDLDHVREDPQVVGKKTVPKHPKEAASRRDGSGDVKDNHHGPPNVVARLDLQPQSGWAKLLVYEACQPIIEWLIAWHNYWIIDLRTSRFTRREVPRNAETGISRGCGYVTMSSLEEAKAAIAALDGSDVGGREMRVRLSVDMNSKRGSTISSSQPRKNLVSESPISSSRPQKNLVFESPFKMYVGNLAWSVKPEDLRNHFSQFGNVISTKVLHDRKGGKNRVYGFLSFSTSAELEAAMSLDDTEFYGRTIKLREVVKWPEPEP